MKKIIAVVLLSLFLLSPLRVNAQGVGDVNDPNGYKISQKEFQEYTAAVENCETPSLECLVRYTTRFVAMEWVNEILGPDNKIVEPAGGTTGADASSVQQRGGLVPQAFGLISMMYANPVADTHTYVADVMNSAGLAPKAYAQGVGFASLNPVLNLWKAFRNIAYFFFILLFIIIGFMIMFRQKIGGQTAVTAQQAIPSILVSLVLVTFSYAIAGFLIDLMYLSMFMIVGIFTDIIAAGIGSENGGQLIDMNIFQLGGTMLSGVWSKTDVTQNLLSDILDAVANSGAGSGLNSFIGMVGGLTLSLVIAIAVLIGIFRLFFELLKSYFSVVVAVVTAPIYLMLGAIPGRNVFWPWFKNIVGNLAAFPTVLLVLVLFLEFTQNGNAEGTTGGFMPPFLVGVGQAGIIGPLIGFATILAMPDIVKKVKQALGANESGPLWDLGVAAYNNLRQAPATARKPIDYAYNAFPLGAGEGMPFRTEGKETGLERLILGSRAFRKRELDYRRQAEIFGKQVPIRFGGLVGAVTNRRRGVQSGTQQTGSGAGSQPVTNNP